MDDEQRYADGMVVRRAVLGDEHVDRSVAVTTPLTAPFQDFITRYAWGDVWSRPGLDRKSRSRLTIALLAALGHADELEMHVIAAVRNGLTAEGFPPRLAEALLHIILSHHGQLEHGSPVVPCTREATLVHFLDNLGGRLGSFDRLEKELPAGATWSGYDRALGSSAFFGSAADVPARVEAA